MAIRNIDKKLQETKDELLLTKNIAIGKIYSEYLKKFISQRNQIRESYENNIGSQHEMNQKIAEMKIQLEKETEKELSSWGKNLDQAKMIYESAKNHKEFRAQESLENILNFLEKLDDYLENLSDVSSVRKIKEGIKLLYSEIDGEKKKCETLFSRANNNIIVYDGASSLSPKEKRFLKTTLKELSKASAIADQLREMKNVKINRTPNFVVGSLSASCHYSSANDNKKAEIEAQRAVNRKKNQIAYNYDSGGVRVKEYIDKEPILISSAISMYEKQVSDWAKGHMSAKEEREFFMEICNWLLEKQKGILNQMTDSKGKKSLDSNTDKEMMLW